MYMNATDAIFYIVILIMSVVIHEVAHGYAAEYFGDNTARNAGRLTLNPLNHIDPFGSIILPIVLVITKSPVLFGWAKPVPYNPFKLKDIRKGTLAVAAAGVLTNLIMAVFFGLIIRFGLPVGMSLNFLTITSVIVFINLGLAIFNLVPIPPLDGSKILFSLLPRKAADRVTPYEKYGLILLLIFVLYFSQYLYPILIYLFKFITGLQFGS